MILYNKDIVRLFSGNLLTIPEEQESPKFKGINSNDQKIPFTEKDIECYKRSYVKPCGGNDYDFWYFYTGPGYKTTKEDVANYAKFELEPFYNMSIDEIMQHHMYFGSDGPSYKGMYNGDTFILYTNINWLDKDMQEDAENHTL